MAITYIERSPTIGASEYSIPANTTSAVPVAQTTNGIFQCFLDLSALAAGDQFQFQLYEKAVNGGTIRKVGMPRIFDGAQGVPNVRLDLGFLQNGWDATLIKNAGTDRAIPCSLRYAS